MFVSFNTLKNFCAKIENFQAAKQLLRVERGAMNGFENLLAPGDGFLLETLAPSQLANHACFLKFLLEFLERFVNRVVFFDGYY